MASLTVFPDPSIGATTVDGITGRSSADETWGTIRAGAGTLGPFTATAASGSIRFQASTTSNQFQEIRRMIATFDTSPLGVGVTISSAILSIFGNGFKQDGLAVTPDLNVFGSTPAAHNDLVVADYSQTGTTSFATPVAYASWVNNTYNDFAFNAIGIAAIVTTSISDFSIKNGNYDAANIAPAWVSNAVSGIDIKLADTAGTSNDPKLVITYTPGAAPLPAFAGSSPFFATQVTTTPY